MNNNIYALFLLFCSHSQYALGPLNFPCHSVSTPKKNIAGTPEIMKPRTAVILPSLQRRWWKMHHKKERKKKRNPVGNAKGGKLDATVPIYIYKILVLRENQERQITITEDSI